jgi:hypothetical protein
MPLDKQKELDALAARKLVNKTRVRIDNAALYAGSPMYFDCDACGGEIIEPEDYLVRRRLCERCKALYELGWIDMRGNPK